MTASLHLFKSWPCGGGMEAVGRLHEGAEKASCLGIRQLNKSFGPWTSLGRIRRALNERLRSETETWRLFYNGYGIEWGVNDGIENRQWIYLHSDFPGLVHWLSRTIRYADGYVCVNEALKAKIHKELPYMPDNRVHVLPLPISLDAFYPSETPFEEKPLVIGYAGRLQFLQKRLDRLPALISALEGHQLDFRIELLGDGDALASLQDRFGQDPRIVFRSHLSGSDYAEVLRSWKYILFLSDYEGLPLSLLEGVASGLIPVYPDFHDGKDWLSSFGSNFLYPHGEMTKAADLIQKNENNLKNAEWTAFCQSTRTVLQGHTESAYLEAFAKLEAIAMSGPARKKRYASPYNSWMPLWMYHRIQRQLQFGSFARPKLKLPPQ